MTCFLLDEMISLVKILFERCQMRKFNIIIQIMIKRVSIGLIKDEVNNSSDFFITRKTKLVVDSTWWKIQLKLILIVILMHIILILQHYRLLHNLKSESSLMKKRFLGKTLCCHDVLKVSVKTYVSISSYKTICKPCFSHQELGNPSYFRSLIYQHGNMFWLWLLAHRGNTEISYTDKF
jgi:hypothetical protein